MDDLEDLVEKGDGVNFIPCLKWIRRGVSKAQPERVKLTQEELSKIIEKTEGDLRAIEKGEADEEEESDVENPDENVEDMEKEEEVNEEPDDGDRDIEKVYDMESYDNDEDENTAGLGGLVAHPNPRDDPYLINPDKDDDDSDIEDYNIKPNDNLLLMGHVEGNAAVLEFYVYNDDEDALYVHHDILLPSYPMALEWLDFDPADSSKANFVAVGSMSPIIDVWDVDIVDTLEPAFSLGQKGSKKKKIPKVGHKDAVLSLAWNQNVRHLLASGSVDQTVLLWDLREGKPARKLTDHKEKVQALQWHPMEAQILLTGCCDGKARVYDCSQQSCKTWEVNGEVEKVLWNQFNPFNFLVATDKGFVHMFDARNDKKCQWTLAAHSDCINGLSLSSQCPGLLVTGSSDKTMKVWDISQNKPSCLFEKDVKIGTIHCLEGCPDAPFVYAFGGETPSHNMHVMDVRESAKVAEKFQDVVLQNNPVAMENAPLANNEAKAPAAVTSAASALEQMSVSSGGASGKFKKKEKKKKKGKNKF